MCTEADRFSAGRSCSLGGPSLLRLAGPSLQLAGILQRANLISDERIISDADAGAGFDIIEAIECLKSWSAAGLIFGTGTEVEQMGKLLEGL